MSKFIHKVDRMPRKAYGIAKRKAHANANAYRGASLKELVATTEGTPLRVSPSETLRVSVSSPERGTVVVHGGNHAICS